MAQESQQRLDAQFPFDDNAAVQLALRLLVKVIEARLAELEAQRADYAGTIETLTEVALGRIDEVLTPSFLIIQQLIAIGFPVARISDSTAIGRALVTAASSVQARTLIGAASSADVTAALADVTGKVSAILAGADPALDTFLELVTRLQNDETGLATVLAALNLRLRYDAPQDLSAGQRAQGLINLGFSQIGREMTAVADAAAVRVKIGAQSELGFVPVTQGGGAGMLGNRIRLGWDGGSIRGDVDGLELGKFWMSYDAIFRSADGTQFYQRLPTGLIVQGGVIVNTATEIYSPFPTAFPSVLFGVYCTSESSAQLFEAHTVQVSELQLGGFGARKRLISNGVVSGSPHPFRWLAFGY